LKENNSHKKKLVAKLIYAGFRQLSQFNIGVYSSAFSCSTLGSKLAYLGLVWRELHIQPHIQSILPCAFLYLPF